MRVGLVGGHYSPDLCILKREIEDRGHRASFLSFRRFPQYALATLTESRLRFDHMDLSEFACFYIGEFEVRERFFRGMFDLAVWKALRERYVSFWTSETESLPYQLSLIFCLALTRPCVNPPASLLATRTRLHTYARLASGGIAVAPFDLTRKGLTDGGYQTARIRVEEAMLHDVPCFPHDYAGCLSITRSNPASAWRLLALKGGAIPWMVLDEGSHPRRARLPREAEELASRALDVLGLDIAEIRIVPTSAAGLEIEDLLPMPRLSEFDDATGERVSAIVAERLLHMGGSN